MLGADAKKAGSNAPRSVTKQLAASIAAGFHVSSARRHIKGDTATPLPSTNQAAVPNFQDKP